MSKPSTSASVDSKDKEGTTAIYVFALIVPIVFTSVLTFLLNLHSRIARTSVRFFTEFIVLVYTVVFHVTILSDFIPEVLAIWAVLASTLVVLNLRKWAVAHDVEHDPSESDAQPGSFRTTVRRFVSRARLVEIPAKHPGYITMLRSTILLITVVCILAVDFKIFPDYSFKTHKYGFSLMDVGIGLFVCSIAMVSSKPPMGHFRSRKNLLRLAWNILPLIVLGVGRAIVIKQIDYHQGVTEYGKHWNAFLTLAFTKLFAMLLASCVPQTKHLVYLGLVVLSLHEAALQYRVADFVMDRKIARDNFFTANREGIVSIPGFVSLELFTMYIGHLLRSSSETITVKGLLNKVLLFGLVAAVLWPAVFEINLLLRVSRRICNMGYVVWILTLLVTMLALYMLVELFAAIMAQQKAKGRNWAYIPLIMQSVNYNGMFFFLMANVLTGMVNMNIDTAKTDKLHSLLILMTYMLVNCLVVTIFYVKKWRIKFW